MRRPAAPRRVVDVARRVPTDPTCQSSSWSPTPTVEAVERPHGLELGRRMGRHPHLRGRQRKAPSGSQVARAHGQGRDRMRDEQGGAGECEEVDQSALGVRQLPSA